MDFTTGAEFGRIGTDSTGTTVYHTTLTVTKSGPKEVSISKLSKWIDERTNTIKSLADDFILQTATAEAWMNERGFTVGAAADPVVVGAEIVPTFKIRMTDNGRRGSRRVVNHLIVEIATGETVKTLGNYHAAVAECDTMNAAARAAVVVATVEPVAEIVCPVCASTDCDASQTTGIVSVCLTCGHMVMSESEAFTYEDGTQTIGDAPTQVSKRYRAESFRYQSSKTLHFASGWQVIDNDTGYTVEQFKGSTAKAKALASAQAWNESDDSSQVIQAVVEPIVEPAAVGLDTWRLYSEGGVVTAEQDVAMATAYDKLAAVLSTTFDATDDFDVRYLLRRAVKDAHDEAAAHRRGAKLARMSTAQRHKSFSRVLDLSALGI